MAKKKPTHAVRSWVARYVTICGLCDEGIDPGEDVVWFEEEVVHVECAEAEGMEVAT